MKKPTPQFCLGLIAGAALLTITGCTTTVHEGGGSASYGYDYYPSYGVYYYPQGRTYYWNDHDHWRSGHNVPANYHFRQEEQHEHLQLHSQQPWTEHHPQPSANGHDDHSHDNDHGDHDRH